MEPSHYRDPPFKKKAVPRGKQSKQKDLAVPPKPVSDAPDYALQLIKPPSDTELFIESVHESNYDKMAHLVASQVPLVELRKIEPAIAIALSPNNWLRDPNSIGELALCALTKWLLDYKTSSLSQSPTERHQRRKSKKRKHCAYERP